MRRWSYKRLSAVGVLVIAAVTALTAGIFSQSGGARATGAAWTWNEPPGKTIAADATAKTMAARNAVATDSIREIVGVDARGGRHQMLSGRGPGGKVCIADRTPVDIGQFGCLDARADKDAILYSQVEGGATTSTVDRSSIVGVGRGDVSRIVITTQGGTEETLPLNEWNGFSYVASDAKSLPVRLVAYGRNDQILQDEAFSYLPPG